MIIINWAVLAVLAIVLIAVMLIYIIRRIMNFTFMGKIKKKYLKVLLSFLPIILLFVIFNMVDAMIVIFHLFIFLVAFDLINKLFKNKHPNLFGFLAIGVTIIYLGIGAYLDYTVFETNYDIVTSKDIEDYSLKDIIWDRAEYEKKYYDDKIVITGHTPTQMIEGNPNPGYIYKKNTHMAIDCGAYLDDGRLAAVCLETGEEFYSL